MHDLRSDWFRLLFICDLLLKSDLLSSAISMIASASSCCFDAGTESDVFQFWVPYCRTHFHCLSMYTKITLILLRRLYVIVYLIFLPPWAPSPAVGQIWFKCAIIYQKRIVVICVRQANKHMPICINQF